MIESKQEKLNFHTFSFLEGEAGRENKQDEQRNRGSLVAFAEAGTGKQC